MWNLKHSRNDQICETNTFTGMANRPVGARGEGRWGGKDWEFGTSRCKLVCVGWINNRCRAQGTIYNIL